MKKNFLFLFVLFLLSPLFALGGLMAGVEGKLSVIQTQYFDIIYPEASAETAQKIAAVCDDYYREISAKFGYEPYERFPVSITDQVESLNAYFSMAPYNTIVLYDTEINYELDMNEKNIESVFYHELVHAVSLNSKAPFWRGMAFFADLLTPAGLSLTSFWMEGAAVAFESMQQGGRLNSPFFTQKLTECKIKSLSGEKSFPSWRDLSGARDTYPAGSEAYIFGSHFAEYLIKTYGLEKYAEFWKNAGTWTSLSFAAGVFKKTYGQAVSDVWQDFYESIPVPEIDFEARKDFVSDKNLVSGKKTVISSVDRYFDKEEGKEKTAWFDYYSSALYLDSKKILTVKNVQRIRFSDDGKKLLVNRQVDKAHIVNEDFEFELKTKKITKIEHDSAIFEKAGNLTAKKDGLSWSLIFEDAAGRKTGWNFGNKIIHNVHLENAGAEEESYIFVWGQMGSRKMARLGRIQIDKNTLSAKISLQVNENSCGLIEAVPYKGDFLVITEEYDSHPLRVLKAETVKWQDFKAEVFDGNKASEDTSGTEIAGAAVSSPCGVRKNYNPAKYFFNGAFFPLGLVNTYDFDFESTDLLPLGATYVTSTPWTDKITMFSAGINPFTKVSGVSASLNGGDDSFSYSLTGSFSVDDTDFNNVYGSLSSSKVLWQGLASSFSVGISALALYGGETTRTEAEVQFSPHEKPAKSEYERQGSRLAATPYLYFSTVRRANQKYGFYRGIYFKPFLTFEKINLDYDFEDFGKIYTLNETSVNAGLTAGLKIPVLLPVDLNATLFPSSDVFAKMNASLQLFSVEVQKGIPAVSVYLRRIICKFVYSGKIKYQSEGDFDIMRTGEIAGSVTKDDYTDYLRLACEASIAPNTSYFASSSVGLNVGSFIQYSTKTTDKSPWKAGFYASF